MTLGELAAMSWRDAAFALEREERDDHDRAIADGEDAYRDLARELLPRRKHETRPS
jgi:hypothetical protein